MHGRLKVRTSAEEAAKKKKEQEAKVKLYRIAVARIQEKRKNNELDQELMELTGKILSANPDVYTMWNIRKECIQKFSEPEKDVDLYDRDLGFTEICLQTNPKSYGAWYHRCWILENSPKPDWNRELELCTKYLKLDERNFHCWDYRRFIVKNADGVTPDKELKFCTEKIEKNFSNYSSWHYRSQLLPKLYPHNLNPSRPISEEKLKEELELVLTAAFTDPNDSSAWFYQRWLLGYSAPEFDIAAFRLVHNFVVISFTKPINLLKNYKIETKISDDFVNAKWIPVNSDLNEDFMWILRENYEPCTKDMKSFDVTLTNIETNEKWSINVEKKDYSFVGFKLPKFEYEFGAGVLDELKNQLNSCNQLLEYEPDSKWTLLTATLLMRSINSKENHKKTLEYLEKLEKVDEMRKGYYQDLASKWQIQNALQEWYESGGELLTIDLSNMKLTTIFYENYLTIFRIIHLNDNLLTNRNICKFIYLQMCNQLNLQQNKIDSLSMIPTMPMLGLLKVDEFNVDVNDLFIRCKNISQFMQGDSMLMRCG